MRRRVAEHRQAKSRLGDEDVAGHGLKTGAGRVALTLVIAGDDDAQALALDHDLGGAQDMSCRHEAEIDLANARHHARRRVLAALCKTFAVAQRHDRQRLAGRQHRAMAGAGVIGMAVRDQRAGRRGARDRCRCRQAGNRARPVSGSATPRGAKPGVWPVSCS